MSRPDALAEAVAAACDKAAKAAPLGGIGVWTEVGRQKVLVAVCVGGAVGAVLVDRSEYDGIKLLEVIDGDPRSKGPARRADPDGGGG